MAEHDIGVRDLAAVRLHLGELEINTCAIPQPRTGLEVKFSIAHLVSMAALHRPLTVIDDADARDADVIALRDKVTVVGDGSSGAPTRVEVTTIDGRELSAAHDANTPDPDTAKTCDRVQEKFSTIAAPILGAERAAATLTAVTTLHKAEDVSRLLALCGG